MALRATAIIVAVSGFAESVSISELAMLLERAGLKGLGFALGVAVNVLPLLQETATTAFQALRLRGGFRRARLRAMRLLLVTIIVNSLRHADNIICAAEARAFSPERPVIRRIKFQRGDVVLVGFLSALLLGVLLL
jgi:energy-coupling factor transporter transmembrane protein EcfT